MIHPVFSENFIPIVFSSDNDYIKYLSVTVVSIVMNSAEKMNYDLIVLGHNIDTKKKEELEKTISEHQNFSLRFFDVAELLENSGFHSLPVSGQLSISAYFRLFIPDLLKTYDRCVYLDADLVVNFDLKFFQELDLDNFLLAAVRDLVICNNARVPHHPDRHYLLNILGFQDIDGYFNSGMLIMNLKEMRAFKFLDKVKDKLKELPDPPRHDQSLLNSVCRGRVYYLDIKYNFLWEYDHSLITDKPLIIHYVGYFKPWHFKNKNELANYFWKYADKSPFYKELRREYLKFSRKNKKKYYRYKMLSILFLGASKKYNKKRISQKEMLDLL